MEGRDETESVRVSASVATTNVKSYKVDDIYRSRCISTSCTYCKKKSRGEMCVCVGNMESGGRDKNADVLSQSPLTS